MSGVGHDAGLGCQATGVGFGGGGQNKGGGAVADGAGVGRGHGTVFGEGRLQVRDFLRLCVARLLVGVDFGVTATARYGYRNNFVAEPTVFDGRQGFLQGTDGKFVHGLAADVVFVSCTLGENAHQAAFVGVFQAVQEHAVHHLAMAHAHAGAGLGQQVRRLAHVFHAASDHDVIGACLDLVVGHDHGLHAGAAHLVDGGAAGAVGNAGSTGGLARRGLAEACGQYATHDHFLHIRRLEAGAFNGGLDGDSAQIRRAHGAEGAHHAAHRGSC